MGSTTVGNGSINNERFLRHIKDLYFQLGDHHSPVSSSVGFTTHAFELTIHFGVTFVCVFLFLWPLL